MAWEEGRKPGAVARGETRSRGSRSGAGSVPPGLQLPISTRSSRTYAVKKKKTISSSIFQRSGSSVWCRTQPARLSPPKAPSQKSAVPGAGPRGCMLPAGVEGERRKKKGCAVRSDARNPEKRLTRHPSRTGWTARCHSKAGSLLGGCSSRGGAESRRANQKQDARSVGRQPGSDG